jgi:hypothetical protein
VKFIEAQKIAKYVLSLKTEDEIKSHLRSVMKKKFPDMPIG